MRSRRGGCASAGGELGRVSRRIAVIVSPRSRAGRPGPRASRRAPRRARRCRSGDRPATPAPAPATCTRRCPRIVCAGSVLDRERRSVSALRRPAATGGSQLGQTEVEDLEMAVAGEKQVVGLQVAVDDRPSRGRRQASRDLDRIVEGLRGGSGPSIEPCAQRLSFEQLRHDVGDPAPPLRCRRSATMFGWLRGPRRPWPPARSGAGARGSAAGACGGAP